MTFSFVVASNDHRVLSTCLLSSPDLQAASAPEISVQENPESASKAYNRGIESTQGDFIIFAHQDLHLPAGWLTRLASEINLIEQTDPNWGVLGLWGVDGLGQYAGWTYSSGLGKVLGGPQSAPHPVRTLDEVLLVVRRSSGLRFDEKLSGFHMYGTDICLAAEAKGMRNYAVSCFAVHNSNGIRQLPWAFWTACWFIRRKWAAELPIHSPCTTVKRWPVGILLQMSRRYLQYSVGKKPVGRRAADPRTVLLKIQSDREFPAEEMKP